MAGTGSIAAGISISESTQSSVYQFETGNFHINCDDAAADGATTFDQFERRSKTRKMLGSRVNPIRAKLAVIAAANNKGCE